MFKEEFIQKANAPDGFKVYESRDGMFSDRIGPNYGSAHIRASF